MTYIARRSPDFFDWRSGLFEFTPDSSVVEQLTQELRENYNKYGTWTETQQLDRIREIQVLIDEEQTDGGRANLLFKKANILSANGSDEQAIASYDKVIEFKPDDHEAWHNRGIALGNLNRYEQAIASYGKAIEFKPDFHQTWYIRACAQAFQGSIDLAFADLTKAIEIEPEIYQELASIDPDLEPLHNDDRFRTLIESFTSQI